MNETKDLNCLTATEAIRAIGEGHISATEITKACIRQIESLEPVIRAWACFDPEKALIQARMVDEKIRSGKNTGILNGVPVGIKDIFNTVDMPTCMGSALWEGFTPGNDARVVSYIRWADGIIAGKTNTAEFAVHYPGPTVNPHNHEYSPGTSSSGSAAAVATCMVPAALGSQTAGSTIRPASYCGIYGFKPSFGLIPRTGILKTLDTLDHVTFFSRSVDDLHLMLDVLRVKGPNFPYVHKYIDLRKNAEHADDRLWKVGFVKTPAWSYAEEYAKRAIVDFVSRLEQQEEITVWSTDLPAEFDTAHDVHELIYTKALSYYFAEEYDNGREKISEIFCDMVERGRRIGTPDYMAGLENQNRLTRRLDQFLDDYDILITLSTAGQAPRGLHGRDKKDSCLIWTLCHVPAINLPVFESPQGLPFGAQIISKRYRDYDLLDFTKYLEREGLLDSAAVWLNRFV
ncbi:MAG: amidase [Thermodesulfobacteriota bacterium]